MASSKVLHHLIDTKDVKAWGSLSMCGKRPKKGTKDHTKVTCKKCAASTNWNADKVRRAQADPLFLK